MAVSVEVINLIINEMEGRGLIEKEENKDEYKIIKESKDIKKRLEEIGIKKVDDETLKNPEIRIKITGILNDDVNYKNKDDKKLAILAYLKVEEKSQR